MATLPTADEAFPLKSADEAFPIEVEQQRYRQQTLGTSPIQDLIFGDTRVNPIARVLDAFGQGAKQGWGAEPAGLSKETEDYLKKVGVFNDYSAGQKNIIKGANEALFRSAATLVVDPIMRGLPALFAGGQAAVARIGTEATGTLADKALNLIGSSTERVGQGVAALPEVFPVGFHATAGIPHAAPHPILAEIQRAKELGVIGEGEAGYFGTKPTEPAVPISGPQEATSKPAGMPVDLFTETKPEAKPAEAAPVEAAPVTPEAAPVAAEAPPAAQTKPVNSIAEDVAGKLIAAGRPEAEARASADLIASHYEARAERFGGQRGTAEDMYAAEGADILPGKGVAPTRSEPIKPPDEGAVAAEPAAPQPPLEGGAVEPVTTIPELKKVLRGRAGDFTTRETMIREPQVSGLDLGKELNQAAYHGSPYDFEVFDTGKIGTGEGAQAYGHGLYFAENERVAAGYRDALAGKGMQTAEGKPIDPQSAVQIMNDRIAKEHPKFGTPSQASQWVFNRLHSGKSAAEIERDIKGMSWNESQKEAARTALSATGGWKTNPTLYKVNIKPEPHEFLNWDKPLSEQSPQVQAALKKLLPDLEDNKLLSKSGESIYRELERPGFQSTPGKGGRLEASALLAEAGIPGIRYLDQGSRALRDVGEVRREIERVQATLERDPNNKTARELLSTYQAQLADAEKGTHNYVVFDPKNIEITDKNGKPVSRKEFELEQIKRGKINFRGEQKPVITLFKESNASTFIHETGHQWLEELMKDAEHPQAPADLKVDAVKVLDWLGVKDASEIKTSHHEKFARGFERYMMEGKAPSQALARVFDHFREWLTRIYQTVTRLKSPINDEIRGVFDRLLTMHPGEVKIEPEGPPKTFADIHEADAEHTPPEMAHPAAETIQGERDSVAARHTTPEDQNARLKNTPDQAVRSEAGNSKSASDANASGSIGREAGNAEASGTLGARGIEVAPESPGTPKVHRTAPPVTAHDPFPDKAGNIRLDNLNTPEDLNHIIRQTAEDNGDFQNVRGPISDAQVLDLAEAAGVDAAFIDARKIGEAWTAPQIVALRRLLIQSAQSVHDLAIKAAAGKEADVMAYAQAKARHQLIQERVASVTAEAGRALRAFQSKFTEGVAGDVNAFLKNATGLTLFQLQKEAAFLSKLQTAQQTSKFVADSAKGGFRRAIVEYYINALISGPVTHTRYVVSNAVNALWTPLFEIPAGAVSGVIRAAAKGSEVDRVRFGEAGAQLYGMVKGSRDGLSAAIEAFKTGVSPPLPTEKMSPHFAEASQAIPGRIGQIVRIPSRSVAGIHSFFKALRYEQNIQALAYREAANEGLRGDAFSNRLADLTTNPTEAMMVDARTNALKELYMAPVDYHSSLGSLIRATNSPTILGTAGKIVVPFMKIGSQITRNAFIERTPLGILDKKVRANLSGEAGGSAIDFQVGKIAAGAALMSAMVGLMAEGMATGDGPEDPAKRAVWLLTHTPASIQIGDISFKYGNTGPLGMLMRFVANTYETAEHMGDKDMATLAVSFFEGFAKSVLDETFLRGVKDMLDAMFHPKEYGGRYIKSQITNWIPWSVGLSQVARKVDPFQRETHGIWQAAQAKIPYLSEQLMPRRDMFGEPIPNGAPPPNYANDPVIKAMDELHIGVGKLGKKIRGVDTTEQQYDDLARIAGRMAKVRLNAMVDIISSPAVPPEKRIEMIHSAISESREAARTWVIMQSMGGGNDIRMKASQAKIDRLRVPAH